MASVRLAARPAQNPRSWARITGNLIHHSVRASGRYGRCVAPRDRSAEAAPDTPIHRRAHAPQVIAQQGVGTAARKGDRRKGWRLPEAAAVRQSHRAGPTDDDDLDRKLLPKVRHGLHDTLVEIEDRTRSISPRRRTALTMIVQPSTAAVIERDHRCRLARHEYVH